MEVWRFGFDPLPPAYKFDPTDTDLVVHYLLPRAVGLPNPYAHAVIDADPCSCPPWELLRRHGRAGCDHAFFFGPPRYLSQNGTRASRTVAAGEDGVGGTWEGQKSEERSLVLEHGGAGGAALAIKYKRHNMSFSYKHGGVKKTTGWVMHDFQITEPKQLSGTILSRVRITDHAKKKCKQQQQADTAQQFVPDPEQPGPSNYFVDLHAAENAVVSSDSAGTSSGAQYGVVHHGDDNGGDVLGEATGYYTDFVNGGENGGCYVDDSNNYCYADFNCYFNQGDGSGGDERRDGGKGG